MNKYRIQVGLRAPETPQESAEGNQIDGMRCRINRAQRDSALIATCFEKAWIMGMSSEETYVTLAYHALIQLEHYAQELLDVKARMPNPGLIFPDKDPGHE